MVEPNTPCLKASITEKSPHMDKGPLVQSTIHVKAPLPGSQQVLDCKDYVFHIPCHALSASTEPFRIHVSVRRREADGRSALQSTFGSGPCLLAHSKHTCPMVLLGVREWAECGSFILFSL